MNIPFILLSRITKTSFLFLLLCVLLQSENNTVLDLCVRDYVISRSSDPYCGLIFSYLMSGYEQQSSISYDLYSDLEIIKSNQKDLTTILEAELSLMTISGKATLFLDLLHPTTDMTKLKQKQQVIRFFQEHENVITYFEKILDKTREGEAASLMLLSEKGKQLTLSEKQENYVKVRVLLDTLYQLFCMIEKLEIKALYPIMEHLQILFFQDLVCAEFRYALHISTFASGASYYFNPFRVISTHKKYTKITPQLFAILFEVIGQLDLSLAIAKLLIKQKDHYCLACYIKKKDNPIFMIQQSWHPLLLTHKTKDEIIKNNFSFPTGIKSILLTGPNTSGKTVITCGFAIAVLLAQTLTFVPATEFVLTPFDAIYTLFTARSEISCGHSRFMSEMQRVKNLLVFLEEAKNNNEYTFLVLDEIFTGTNQNGGTQAAQVFLQQYASNKYDKNTLLFLSTHYREITQIAQQTSHSNYKIDIIRKNDGSLHHTFTMVPGVSEFPLITILLQKSCIC